MQVSLRPSRGLPQSADRNYIQAIAKAGHALPVVLSALTWAALHFYWALLKDDKLIKLGNGIYSDATDAQGNKYTSVEEAIVGSTAQYTTGRILDPSLRDKIKEYIDYLIARIKQVFGKPSKEDFNKLLHRAFIKRARVPSIG